MEVILLETVRNLGKLGNRVKVKPGYGRNFLIPYGKAVVANQTNTAKFELQRAELEAKAQAFLDTAKARAEKLQDVTVKIEALAKDEGKLYGSVGPNEIVKALLEQGHEAEKREVLMPEGPLHYLGEFVVTLQLHSELTADINVVITAAKD